MLNTILKTEDAFRLSILLELEEKHKKGGGRGGEGEEKKEKGQPGPLSGQVSSEQSSLG